MYKKILVAALSVYGILFYAQTMTAAHAEYMNNQYASNTASNAYVAMDDSDKTLTDGVQSALKDDVSLVPSLGHVQLRATKDGAVYLRGTVNTMQEKSNIEGRVRVYPGVLRVYNDIKVKSR